MNLLIGFWGLLLAACIVWYSTITIYIAIRGVADIKHMLRNLAASDEKPSAKDDEAETACSTDHTAV